MEDCLLFGEYKAKRMSSSSTIDQSFEIDQLFPANSLAPRKLSLEVNCFLFEEISEEEKKYYNSLVPRLSQIYEELSKNLDPINVRDDCSHHAKRISISHISESIIHKRRQSVKK